MTPPMCRIVVKKSINEGFLPEERSVVRGVWASFQTHWSVLHFFCYKWYVLSGLHPLKGSFPFKLGRAEMIISCVIQKRSTQKSEAGIAPVWLRQVRYQLLIFGWTCFGNPLENTSPDHTTNHYLCTTRLEWERPLQGMKPRHDRPILAETNLT